MHKPVNVRLACAGGGETSTSRRMYRICGSALLPSPIAALSQAQSSRCFEHQQNPERCSCFC